MMTGVPTHGAAARSHANEVSFRENLGCIIKCVLALSLYLIIILAVAVTLVFFAFRGLGGYWRTDILHAEGVLEVNGNRKAADVLDKLTHDVDLPDSVHDISIATYHGRDTFTLYLACHGNANELLAFLRSFAMAGDLNLTVLNPDKPQDRVLIDSDFLHPSRELLSVLPPWHNVHSGGSTDYYQIGVRCCAALARNDGVLYIIVY